MYHMHKDPSTRPDGTTENVHVQGTFHNSFCLTTKITNTHQSPVPYPPPPHSSSHNVLCRAVPD